MGGGPQGPSKRELREAEFQKRRKIFHQEALRKKTEIARLSGGRGQRPFMPRTLLNSSIDPQAVGTTLIVGRG